MANRKFVPAPGRPRTIDSVFLIQHFYVRGRGRRRWLRTTLAQDLLDPRWSKAKARRNNVRTLPWKAPTGGPLFRPIPVSEGRFPFRASRTREKGCPFPINPITDTTGPIRADGRCNATFLEGLHQSRPGRPCWGVEVASYLQERHARHGLGWIPTCCVGQPAVPFSSGKPRRLLAGMSQLTTTVGSRPRRGVANRRLVTASGSRACEATARGEKRKVTGAVAGGWDGILLPLRGITDQLIRKRVLENHQSC